MVTIRPKQPWFSDDLYGAKREKRKWERKWRDTNLTVHYDLFKTATTKFNNMLIQAKKDYYNNLIAESSTDSKNLSNIVKDILHQRSEMKLPEHASTEELANRFAVFFTDKVCKIREELPDLSRHQLNLPTPALTCSLNVFSAVTESEVRKIISKSPTKSCSLDPAPTWMVKDSVDELIPMVTILVNLSLQSANVPDSMKQALVTLLLKKDDLDPEVLKNYRPVSNLSFLSKVLERVVAARLTNYMTINQLHEPMQSAYRACHSTETALVRVQNDILRTLDQGGAAILVLLDLSAAFDTIDHSILLSRMESVLGVKGSALQWFKSYLLGRKQRIKINDDFSENQEILWSVPQGSVLGALLFLIYIIPLAQLIRSYGLNNHGYADDTQLCLSFKKTSDNAIVKREILNLEKCLCDISVWMSQNKLKLNNDKTEIILFGSKKHLAELNIKSLSVAGTDVSVASEPVRNLGAMFDSQLTMAPHVKSVVKKSSFHLRNIGKARRVLTEDATKTVMQSLVMSHLDYCNALLIGIQQDLIAKLQRLQNSAARIVSRTRKYEHITPVLIKLHWLPIKFRIQFKVLMLVYKALNGLAPKYIKELLVPYKPRRHLRSEAKGLLDEPRTRLKFGDRAFSISAPRLWNALPQHLKDSTSCQAFKKCLKTHLFRLAH